MNTAMDAHASELRLGEAIRGANRAYIGGGRTRGGGEFSLIDHAGPDFSGIVEYSPDELCLTARAGTPMAEIEAELAKHNQMLGFEPMDHRRILKTNGEPTLGGALGVNADGPARLRYGAIRDAALGLRFIDGQGRVLRAGGKVMKNVTGLDLTRLMIGSRGSLGAITSATLKTLPLPAKRVSIALEMPANNIASVMGALMRQPLGITGLHWSAGALFIRIDGPDPKPAISRIEDQFGKSKPSSAEAWADLRDWALLSDCEEIWRVFLRASKLDEMIGLLDGPFLIACGGNQLVTSERPGILPMGAHMICEKGPARGLRVGDALAPQQQYLGRLRAIFDPNSKFAPLPAAPRKSHSEKSQTGIMEFQG